VQAAPASVEEPANYRKTVEEAVREFEARNYAEARALFEQAYALYPSAPTERGMGFAEFELRHYGQCIVHLEAALSSTTKSLTPELRRETEELLGRAKSFVAYVRLDAKPASAAILIDGVTVELPAGEPLMLEVGDHIAHVLSVRAMLELRDHAVELWRDLRPANVRCSDTTPQICNADGTAWTDQAPQAGTT
jgi:hypothetical protein